MYGIAGKCKILEKIAYTSPGANDQDGHLNSPCRILTRSIETLVQDLVRNITVRCAHDMEHIKVSRKMAECNGEATLCFFSYLLEIWRWMSLVEIIGESEVEPADASRFCGGKLSYASEGDKFLDSEQCYFSP